MNNRNYLEINSTYRDRILFPNPADFDVIWQPKSQSSGISFISPATDELAIYPSASIAQPLTFWENTSMVVEEITHLPYMYSTTLTGDTIFLDELPQTPETPTNLTIPFDPTYPRCSIPLSNIDNFYIDKFIENFNTGEVRKIIKYNYSSTEVILQIGQLSTYNVIDPINNIEVVGRSESDLTISNRPLSNIPYYYQGKTIRFFDGPAAGQESIICVYRIDPISGLPTMKLLTPFSVIPQPGDSFYIISKNNYYATLDAPFSTPLPTYPVYIDPLSLELTNPRGYEYDYIDTIPFDRVLASFATQMVRHTDNTYGLMAAIFDRLYYYRSTDTDGKVWVLANFVDRGLAMGLQSLNLVSGNPAVANQASDGNGIGIFYRRATTLNGTAWGGNFSLGVPDACPTTFKLHENAAGEPLVFFSNNFMGATPFDIQVRHTATISGSGGWASFPTGVNGVIGDVIFNTTDSRWYINYEEYAAGVSTGRSMLIISDDATAMTWGSPATIVQDTLSINYKFAPSEFIQRSTGLLQLAYYEFNSTNLWTQNPTQPNLYRMVTDQAQFTEIVAFNIPFDSYANGWYPLSLYEAPIPGTGTTEVYFFYVANGNTELNIIKESQIDTPNNVDTLIRTDNIIYFDVRPSDYDFNPIVGIGSLQRLLSVLTAGISFIDSVGVQYRIRENEPFMDSAELGSFTGVSDTQLILPPTASSVDGFYVGKYIWVYNEEVNPVPTPFHMFNDYRYIVEYDGSTRTVTVAPPFSADLTLTATNLVLYELLDTQEEFNSLDYSQSRLVVQQPVCYEIQLLSLSLPNVFLEAPIGNRIAFYNYIYVELTPISDGNSGQLFISNSPFSRRMLFHVPITNVNSPERAAFVQLRGVMSQTIKFNPMSDFHFAVYLSTGELFITPDDTLPPEKPDFNLQISALFEYRRLT